MGNYSQFEEQLKNRLDTIGEDILRYDESEFWMIQSEYEFIEYYAAKYQLMNTAIALPLARGLHNGVHRKSKLIRDDISYPVPYVIHPLQVCRYLIELHLPLSLEEQDILYAAALCHDMIEDVEFAKQGTELYEDFGLDKEVYHTVKLVSKRKDFTEEEEQKHFQDIAHNKFAILVKLCDRSNNVEDLYNRSSWKVHEYVGETRKYFMPMLDYGEKTHLEVASGIAVLRDKITSLTEAAEFLVYKYDQQEKVQKERLEVLRKENEELRKTWKELWKKSLMSESEQEVK